MKEKLIIGLTFPKQDLNLGLEPSILTVLPRGDNVRVIVNPQATGLPEEDDVELWLCSVYITGMHEFFRFAGEHPREKIVVGGYEPTINPQDFVRYSWKVITGPCDSFWDTVGQPGRVVRGITKYETIPRYDLWDIHLNQQIIPDKRPTDRVTSINTSQGCPFRCDFCCSPLMSDHIISKPLTLVKEECEVLRGLQPKFIFIRDENFPLQRDWKEKLLEIEKVGAKIYLFASANLLTKPTVEFMKEHGVYMICLGLEDVLKDYGKNRDLDVVCQRLHEAGIYVYLSFIVDPIAMKEHRTEACYYQRLQERFVKLKPEMVCGNFLMPFRGTKLWEEYKRYITEEDFDEYNSKSAFLEKDPVKREHDEWMMFKVQKDYYYSTFYIEHVREFRIGDTLHNRFIDLWRDRFKKYEEANNC